jgi:hypothetical protein
MCFDNDDRAEMYELKRVRVRKPHRCDGCGKTIERGEHATHHTGLFDGAWFSDYECDDCRRLTLSIAVEELRHRCSWSDAWCPLSELRSYVADRSEPVKLLEGTLEECRQQVDAAWDERQKPIPSRLVSKVDWAKNE